MAYAVKFECVSKRYAGGGPRYASLRHDLSEWSHRLNQRHRGKPVERRGTLALDGVSFEVEEGESFAIIGPNGAGKSTALKVLSRITYPTGGRVRVKGRVGALIEVGSGVHPELTARENIRLYGQILGMGRADIRDRFDEIVEFAELGHVLDTPVKMYSSGMQLRLGFAIASHLDPDVFVVDEALAVGDAGFQARCVERMAGLVGEGRTLIFVSHNLAAVEAMCQKGLFLLDGRVMKEGSTREALGAYLAWVEQQRFRRAPGEGTGVVKLLESTCHTLDGTERYEFESGQGLEIRLRFASEKPIEGPLVNIGITDGRPGLLVHCSMLTDGTAPDEIGTLWRCHLRIASLPLRPRLYRFFCDVYTSFGHGVLMDWQEAGAFRIHGKRDAGPLAIVNAAMAGAVEVPYTWRVESDNAVKSRPEALVP
jgi:ABC-type polysaccharide/polyol phosphate transport system ATPase subunit